MGIPIYPGFQASRIYREFLNILARTETETEKLFTAKSFVKSYSGKKIIEAKPSAPLSKSVTSTSPFPMQQISIPGVSVLGYTPEN